MNRGLVIGKFMPVHHGHIALIRFAAARCDELIVSMSARADDPIDPEARFEWLRQTVGSIPNVRVNKIHDDFDKESLPLNERTKTWAAFIRKIYPEITTLFSSEEYGEPLSRWLGATHVSFDRERNTFPVSASMIRRNPFAYWEFIPHEVKPYFVKKVCFYGPESTGKSSATIRMAEKYRTEFVPEVAREFLITNDFSVDDIIAIGRAHYQRICDILKTANKLLFCDTDVITTQIYSQHYLGVVPDILLDLESKVRYDIYFLFDVDVPWVSDGLRDLPHKRGEMFEIFRKELDRRKIPFTLVNGSWEQRERIMTEAIERFLP